jgi:hypothetical protein
MRRNFKNSLTGLPNKRNFQVSIFLHQEPLKRPAEERSTGGNKDRLLKKRTLEPPKNSTLFAWQKIIKFNNFNRKKCKLIFFL